MKHRQVAVILHSTSPYRRKTLLGIGAYPPKPQMGTLFRRAAAGETPRSEKVGRRRNHPLFRQSPPRRGRQPIGLADGRNRRRHRWRSLALQIPYFATDNRAIGQLGAEHLIEPRLYSAGLLRLSTHAQGTMVGTAGTSVRKTGETGASFPVPSIRVMPQHKNGPICKANSRPGSSRSKNRSASWPQTTPGQGTSWKPAAPPVCGCRKTSPCSAWTTMKLYAPHHSAAEQH